MKYWPISSYPIVIGRLYLVGGVKQTMILNHRFNLCAAAAEGDDTHEQIEEN